VKHIIAGTAGHIDHGKTALVRALTGIDTDRLEEEKRRGISIDLGFAHLDLARDLRVAVIDVPGHERFIKNMLAGVGGIDFVILVVAADESIKMQTREHFEICRLLRIRAGVVAVTKADLVDEDTLGSLDSKWRISSVGRFWKALPSYPSVPLPARDLRNCDPRLSDLHEQRPHAIPLNCFGFPSIGRSSCRGSALS
jgi:selenocysteine-specific elongation factor